MLKSILVHIPTERPIRPVVDAAVSLAARRAAHLDAVSIGLEVTNVDLAPDGGAALAAVIEIEQERALAQANAALAAFETEARNAEISYGLQPLIGAPAETAATVTALARLYDLTIVLQSEPGGNAFDNTIPEEILFQSGGPVLLIPIPIKAHLSRSTSASHGMEAAWRRARFVTPRRFWHTRALSPSSRSTRRKYQPRYPRQPWSRIWEGAGLRRAL